jgi:hypothetical protein
VGGLVSYGESLRVQLVVDECVAEDVGQVQHCGLCVVSGRVRDITGFYVC